MGERLVGQIATLLSLAALLSAVLAVDESGSCLDSGELTFATPKPLDASKFPILKPGTNSVQFEKLREDGDRNVWRITFSLDKQCESGKWTVTKRQITLNKAVHGYEAKGDDGNIISASQSDGNSGTSDSNSQDIDTNITTFDLFVPKTKSTFNARATINFCCKAATTPSDEDRATDSA